MFSQNPRVVEVGSSGPRLLLKQGRLEQAAQDHVQTAFSYLQFLSFSSNFQQLCDGVHKALVMEVAHFLNLTIMVSDSCFQFLHETTVFFSIINRPKKKTQMLVKIPVSLIVITYKKQPKYKLQKKPPVIKGQFYVLFAYTRHQTQV